MDLKEGQGHVYWDNAPENTSNSNYPRYGIVKVSEGWSDEIEYLNNDYVGSLKSFEKENPIRLLCEFPTKYVDASHLCVDAFRKIFSAYEIRSFDKKVFELLMHRLKSQMISHTYIPHITNHFP